MVVVLPSATLPPVPNAAHIVEAQSSRPRSVAVQVWPITGAADTVTAEAGGTVTL